METYTCQTKYEGPPPPKGYRIKCVRAPKKGEEFMSTVDSSKVVACGDVDIHASRPILARIEPVRLTKWVNVYPSDRIEWSDTEKEARQYAQLSAIAVAVPVTIEYYLQQ